MDGHTYTIKPFGILLKLLMTTISTQIYHPALHVLLSSSFRTFIAQLFIVVNQIFQWMSSNLIGTISSHNQTLATHAHNHTHTHKCTYGQPYAHSSTHTRSHTHT